MDPSHGDESIGEQLVPIALKLTKIGQIKGNFEENLLIFPHIFASPSLTRRRKYLAIARERGRINSLLCVKRHLCSYCRCIVTPAKLEKQKITFGGSNTWYPTPPTIFCACGWKYWMGAFGEGYKKQMLWCRHKNCSLMNSSTIICTKRSVCWVDLSYNHKYMMYMWHVHLSSFWLCKKEALTYEDVTVRCQASISRPTLYLAWGLT